MFLWQKAREQRWVAAVVVLGAIVRIWAPGPTTETYDESLWLARTDRFVHALRTGDLDAATPGDGRRVTTMPGVTVMWSGVAGRTVAKAVGRLGLIAPVAGPSTSSPAVLRAARAVEAVLASVALGALVWVAGLLVGRRAAAIAGVLLATDPFLVGHGNLLHTDSLVTVFSALGVVAAMAAAWAPCASTSARRRATLIATSGAATALALLTKLNAIPVVAPALAAIVAVELVDRLRGRAGPAVAAVRSLVVAVVGWTAVAGAVALATWPALWTSPGAQLDRMRESSELASKGAPVPAWAPVAERHAFVPINLLVRLSPWMLVGGVVSVVAVALAWALRRWPPTAPPQRVVALLLLAPVPYLAYLERQPRVFDRYLLPAWPFLALVIGIVVAQLVAAVPAREASRRAGAAVATAVLTWSVVSVAPYGTAYADPLLGARRTEELSSLGWGEGVERLGATIEALEGPHCEQVEVAIRYPMRIAVPCGTLIAANDPAAARARYVIVEVRHRQRRSLPIYALAEREGELVQRVRIGGVSYAELWRLPN